MNLDEFIKKQLKENPEFKNEWERFDLWFELGQWWLELRCIISSWFRA